MATKDDYIKAFDLEQKNTYPVMDAFENEHGYSINRVQLLVAARVLACPVKINPPNWQHGRLIYTALRDYCASHVGQPILCLDIGTAKGFSALIMRIALDAAGAAGIVDSVDVIDPDARVARNTIAEVDGLKTLNETLDWCVPQRGQLAFYKSTGVEFLTNLGANERINFAFVDGKHNYDSVAEESYLIQRRQLPGDVIIFDDVHIPGIAHAVDELTGYALERIEIKPERAYAIATRM